MTDNYKQRLIALAQEILDIRDNIGGFSLNKQEIMNEKLNYLLGYIMALKEHVQH